MSEPITPEQGLVTLTRREQPLADEARGVPQLGAVHDPVRRGERRQLLGVPRNARAVGVAADFTPLPLIRKHNVRNRT